MLASLGKCFGMAFQAWGHKKAKYKEKNNNCHQQFAAFTDVQIKTTRLVMDGV